MKVIPIPCAFDNYSYLLICEQTGAAAVVDPTEFYPVYKALDELGVRLSAILCTHHHHDHIGGMEELLAEYEADVTVYGFRDDMHRIPGITQPVIDGDTVRVGDLFGSILHTPGHTTGSICYSFGDCLFVGDTLFGGGCGRLFEGTPAMMFASLMEKIFPLPDDTRIFFGHEYTALNLRFAASVEEGNLQLAERMRDVQTLRGQQLTTTPSILALEKATNPFLRCSDHEFVQRVCDTISCHDRTPLAAFTALRELRNNFS